MSRAAAGENWGGSRLPTPERAAQPDRGWGPQAARGAGRTPPRWRPADPAPRRHLPPFIFPPWRLRERAELLQLASASPGPGAQRSSARTRRASPAFRTAPHTVVTVTAQTPQEAPRSPSHTPWTARHPGLPSFPSSWPLPGTLGRPQHALPRSTALIVDSASTP